MVDHRSEEKHSARFEGEAYTRVEEEGRSGVDVLCSYCAVKSTSLDERQGWEEDGDSEMYREKTRN